MTDADDTALVEAWDAFDYCCKLGSERGWCSIEAIHLDTVKEAYEAQRREIEELRREVVDKNSCFVELKRHMISEGCAYCEDGFGAPFAMNIRAEQAEKALIDAANVIAPFAKLAVMWEGPDRTDIDLFSGPLPFRAYRAASAFAAKHGGRE